MANDQEFEKAGRRAKTLLANTPKIVAAWYDSSNRRIVLSLDSKVYLSFRPQDAQGLENASATKLNDIEITLSGLGVYFPRLDVDLYLPGMLKGIWGTRKWMAAQLGKAGGSSKSKAKVAASRANGKLGGRPIKHTTIAAGHY